MIKPLLTSHGNEITDQYGMPLYEESPLAVPHGIGNDTVGSGAIIVPGERDKFELFRDAFPREMIDPSDWKPLIDAGGGDNRPYRKWTLSQKSVGSCGSEGESNCYVTQRHRRGYKSIKFNPYVNYVEAGGGRDNGSSLYANIVVGMKYHIPMELWPREGPDAHPWYEVPPPSSPIWKEGEKYRILEAYDIDNWIAAASALYKGDSVYAAYPGHAWELIAVINSQQGIINNSWSKSWGDNGMAVISSSKMTWMYGIYAIPAGTEGT